FNHAAGLAEKVMLMERILTGNILSCAKGLDEYFSQRINCKILDIDYEGNKAYKGIELLNFSATFKTNVMIPQWLGLGKSVSLNHGTVISL
ncbi:MAG: CRISPR-associated endonuclease Cas6, partial [Muribaculaceae bacterium]|nr:CRISPR-associated endonuclease Cas6 [Muribaculaceae bacterium]